jgi:hypothetical protein
VLFISAHDEKTSITPPSPNNYCKKCTKREVKSVENRRGLTLAWHVKERAVKMESENDLRRCAIVRAAHPFRLGWIHNTPVFHVQYKWLLIDCYAHRTIKKNIF